MKNRILLLVVCSLFVFFLEASLNFENAFGGAPDPGSPTCDCEATLRAWRMHPNIGPAIADQYYCPHPHRPPVLKSSVPWSTTAPDAPNARAAEDQIIKWELLMERGK